MATRRSRRRLCSRRFSVRIKTLDPEACGGFKLTETLQGLGLEDAFDASRADFSAMDKVFEDALKELETKLAYPL